MDALPVGLHQLSLEENPWICDCRLWALKRWLASSRTPLSAAVRCLGQSAGSAGELPDSGRLSSSSSSAADLQLNQLSEQEFVCAPKPAWAVGEQVPGLSALAGYLELALVRRPTLAEQQAAPAPASAAPSQKLRPNNLQANEGKSPDAQMNYE